MGEAPGGGREASPGPSAQGKGGPAPPIPEQRNALCAFGQADQDSTVANLMIAGAAAVKLEAAKALTELADRLCRLAMSDTEYQTLFYTVKYRKERDMTRLILDY